MAGGGAEYLAEIRKAGREPDPDDLPPPLDWEAGAWWLYSRVETQWRIGAAGAVGLDYGPAIALIQARGWRLELALELLQVIEMRMMAAGD